MIPPDELASLLRQSSIVACGTLRREIMRLANDGVVDGRRLWFTAPGLHEWPARLREQLTRQLGKACDAPGPVVVVYGESCYFDFETSTATDGLIEPFGPKVARVPAKSCVDMLANAEERERIADGARVYWFTPGWIEHWDFIFKDWDLGKANETFPSHEKAIVLDGTGYFDMLSNTDPEKILRICDWMKLPLEPHAVSLNRLGALLLKAVGMIAARRAGEQPRR